MLATSHTPPPSAAPSFIDYHKSVEELIDEMQIDREDVNAGKSTEEAEIIDEPGMYTGHDIEDDDVSDDASAGASPIKTTKIDLSEASLEAHFLAQTVDKLNALICGGISKELPENFYADKAEFKTIEKYFLQYRKDATKKLPLWLQLSITLGTIYGPKYVQAFQVRKMKARQSELESENEDLRTQILEIRELLQNIGNEQKNKDDNTSGD